MCRNDIEIIVLNYQYCLVLQYKFPSSFVWMKAVMSHTMVIARPDEVELCLNPFQSVVLLHRVSFGPDFQMVYFLP